ncbi:TonB-dependent receptor [Reichenbachiella carrageenanivorans]|uniref:TonB-dependent receptor n=1 Tax=Reichenbachiella carrageenanivorans TaxID=2979869 RepID=A0ABY6D1D0_9BACT|nr:TonB-dependent receptor [Reichenbachiella carrageenanivorans]UXX77675.1 TonB-dependent receptor [Reichenbachiella carrageenanivorans]
MKQLFTFLIINLIGLSAIAQDIVIRGTVTDESTGERLPGAIIKVDQTTSGTLSDVDGEFVLRVNPGQINLIISYLGYNDITLEANADTDVFVDVQLSELISELEEVTVFGSLQGQQKALNQQRSSGNIKNIVAADQISRFPDPNVAEALQRIPGVTLQRDQGEGRYVIVRGLSPQFTNININGEQIPSPESGVRFVALDAIPAEQLSSIEVSKTLSPDMDGDAVGGSVNLVTRKAKSGTPEIQGTLLGGYNNELGKVNSQGSLLLGQRFGLEQKLGVMLNASHYFNDLGSDGWERDDSDLELRDYELRRTRSAISGTIDYRFNPTSEIYFRGIYNSFTDREVRRRYVFVPNTDDSPFEDNEIERLTKDRFEKQDVSSYNLGGKHVLPKFTIDYEVSYALALQDTPFDYEVNFIGEPDAINIDFQPDYPVFSTNSEFDYLDNSNYEFDELEAGNTYSQDRNITGKVNVAVPYAIGQNQGFIKFGGKYRAKDKELEVTNNKYGWQGGDISFNGETGDFTLDKFSGGLIDNDYLGGRYSLSAAPDMGKVMTFFNANQNGFELEVEDKLVDESVESYTASEDVIAAYLMTDVTFNKLQVIGGVRFEQTNVDYKYNTVFFDEDGDLDEIVSEEGTTDYTFVLPQVNLKYALNSMTNLRLAGTMSYARPNFESIVPAQEINLADKEGTIGNPALKPVSAINVDLMVDHYFGTVGVISAGIFYKNLDSFIYKRRFETDSYLGRDFGQTIELTQDVNGQKASLTGIEIAYQQNLTFLPGFLSGFGLYANYTFTTSSATLKDRSGLGDSEEIDLPGQAKHVGNLSLSYSLKGFTARVSGNYAGAYLAELGADTDEDEYIKGRLQVDATANYQISDHFNVFAEFLNITNAPYEAYIGGNENHPSQREFYSWWSRIGVKVNF